MYKSSTDLCVRIEQIKREFNFESYTESVLYFIENESDHEVEQVVRYLNPKILDSIRQEAVKNNNLKDNEEVLSIL